MNATQAITSSKPEPDLPGLIEEITGIHRSAVRTAGALASDVLYIGELLLKAQALVKAAGLRWKNWVPDNLPFGVRQANKYLQLARNPRGISGDMTLKAALKAMIPPEGKEPKPFNTDRAISKIVRLIEKTLEDWPESQRAELTQLEKILNDALKMSASIRKGK